MTLTLIHVVISLIGIVSGFVVIYGFFTSSRLDGWTALFLITTVLTSVTGFFFPFHKFTPAHAVGILSLVILAVAILGRYRFDMSGGWRSTYVITAMIAQYLNFFVLVVQSFAKVAVLKTMAPTQSEPPFAITQGIVLLLFICLGVLAVKKFRVTPVQATALSSASAR